VRSLYFKIFSVSLLLLLYPCTYLRQVTYILIYRI
jgi:hypothetical protein